MEKLYTNLLRFGKTHTNIKIGGKYPLGNIVRNQTQNFKIVEELTHCNVDLLRNTDNMEGSWRKT